MATGELFGRIASVQVDELQFEDLRVAFEATKTITKDPNKLDLKIYNLNEQSRGRIQKQDAVVIVQAGYVGTGLSQIFNGNARTISHSYSGVDWITKVACGDGEKAIRTARISKSFKAGVDAKAVFKDLLGAVGLPSGNAQKTVDSASMRGLGAFTSGFSLQGSAYDLLHERARAAGLRLFVHDGQLQMLGDKDTTVDTAVYLSADTGLKGSPERGEKGVVKARSFLNPDIFPGRRVQLDSLVIKGVFRCEKVVHKADTHGGVDEWESTMELKEV